MDVLLSKAEFYYDQGDFEKALEYAEEAYDLSPNNETVGILLGYINLALGGIDTFALAKGLMSLNTKSSSSSSKSLIASSKKNAADTLNNLRPILGIKDADILQLGEVVKSEDFEAFSDLTVIYPEQVTKVRKTSKVNVIRYIDSAIKYICPFVDPEVKMPGDQRHKEKNCPETDNIRYGRAKSHFIWAFGHLAEALAFNAVVLFKEEDADKPNIELRTDALAEAGLDIGDYVAHVQQLSEDIAAIFAVGDSDSQIIGVLNDLTSVSKAFARLAGLPDSVTAGINKALKSIEEKSKQIGDEADKGSALKSQFTKKLSEELAAQLDDLPVQGSDGAPSQEELDELCSAYEGISAGGSASRPEACT